MIFSVLCTILVAFGPKTSEFTLPFVAIRQKSAYHAQNISQYPGLTLTYFTGLVVVLVGMIFQIFVWRSPS